MGEKETSDTPQPPSRGEKISFSGSRAEENEMLLPLYARTYIAHGEGNERKGQRERQILMAS